MWYSNNNIQNITRIPMSALHFWLSLYISSLKFLSCIILSMPSCQLLLGLSGFLLSGSFQFITCFEIRVSNILCTCPYHMSCLFYISFTIVCVTCIISLIRSFVTLSNLDLSVALQKSIPVTSNTRFVDSPIVHIS